MHPAFAVTQRRLLELREEFGHFIAAESLVVGLLTQNTERAAEWARNALRGTGIESVYTGIEGILKDLLIETDGQVFAPPESWHAHLLAQAAAGTDERASIISEPVYTKLDEIRRFRHVERNVYRQEFREPDVVRNLELLKEVFPEFVTDIDRFVNGYIPLAPPGSTRPS
jgi:hypothetical protein